MTDTVTVALIAGLGPTLLGVAAVIQSTRGHREARAANKAVNNVGPDELTLKDEMRMIRVRTDEQSKTLESVARDVADVKVRVGVLERMGGG